jgi:hypothetical protein
MGRAVRLRRANAELERLKAAGAPGPELDAMEARVKALGGVAVEAVAPVVLEVEDIEVPAEPAPSLEVLTAQVDDMPTTDDLFGDEA